MTAQGGTGERVILDRVTGRVVGVEANPAQKPPFQSSATAPTPVGALAPACDECGLLMIDQSVHAAMHAARRCLNCGHDSPHCQQHDDECWCGCADYMIERQPLSAAHTQPEE